MFNEHTKHTLESVQIVSKYHINSLKYTIITQSGPFYNQGFFECKKSDVFLWFFYLLNRLIQSSNKTSLKTEYTSWIIYSQTIL